jgi:hypothetical protein
MAANADTPKRHKPQAAHIEQYLGRELVRRATLRAAESAGNRAAPTVSGEDLLAGLDDLLEHSAPVLRSMLGATPP